MTRRCINEGTCYEANPMVPKSLPLQMTISGATVTGAILIAHAARKQHMRLWWLAPVMGITVHAVGIKSSF